jgi:pyruvate dehydrogenase E1 component alpha subunit
MRLTRTFDELMVATWKQGRGLGGVFSQRGHEAISVGCAWALQPNDVVAPMHRDLGCYLVRGMAPRRVFANMLGRQTGPSRGRDANLHGAGDLSLNLIGFISHLPQSLPVAVGAAMAFTYRNEPRVAMTFVGDGSSSAGVFHESVNLAAVHNAPIVIVLENNQYAYSTPLSQQMRVHDMARRAESYGIPGAIVDGNDVEAVYAATCDAVDRARGGGGPALLEMKTMRMLGHAIHDGAEYVPAEVLAEWEKRDPVMRFEQRLVAEGIADAVEIAEIGERCERETVEALEYAENSRFPDPATVLEGVYAP